MKGFFVRVRLGLFPGSIFVVGVLLQMEESEPLSLLDVRLALDIAQALWSKIGKKNTE